MKAPGAQQFHHLCGPGNRSLGVTEGIALEKIKWRRIVLIDILPGGEDCGLIRLHTKSHELIRHQAPWLFFQVNNIRIDGADARWIKMKMVIGSEATGQDSYLVVVRLR